MQRWLRFAVVSSLVLLFVISVAGFLYQGLVQPHIVQAAPTSANELLNLSQSIPVSSGEQKDSKTFFSAGKITAVNTATNTVSIATADATMQVPLNGETQLKKVESVRAAALHLADKVGFADGQAPDGLSYFAEGLDVASVNPLWLSLGGVMSDGDKPVMRTPLLRSTHPGSTQPQVPEVVGTTNVFESPAGDTKVVLNITKPEDVSLQRVSSLKITDLALNQQVYVVGVTQPNGKLKALVLKVFSSSKAPY